jgi:hypothetical protein
MKKSDIYEITVKILGLYLITHVIPIFVSLLQYITEYNSDNDFTNNGRLPFYIFLESIDFVATVIICRLFIFKTKWVVAQICDPEDFQENARLFAQRKTVYEIAFRITGLILIIWALPNFSINITSHIQWVQSHPDSLDSNNYSLWVDGLEILFGLILLLGTKGLVEYFGGKEPETGIE